MLLFTDLPSLSTQAKQRQTADFRIATAGATEVELENWEHDIVGVRECKFAGLS